MENREEFSLAKVLNCFKKRIKNNSVRSEHGFMGSASFHTSGMRPGFVLPVSKAAKVIIEHIF
jgi:hypothetical protein